MDNPLNVARALTSFGTSLLRVDRGVIVKGNRRQPEKTLELYSFEASPYSRLAREVLCELEIKYLLHNCGKTPGGHSDYYPPELRYEHMHNYMPGTENRRKFLERAGRIMMPYIVDPNTGVDMFQSRDVQAYLRETYGA